MLSLSSPRWSELTHAYGSAQDVPGWLLQLENLPSSEGNAEPWFSIWSALAHQGDVYSASFAAVPHVVAALASAPGKADTSYFQFPAWVEICRAKSGVAVPSELSAAYASALARLPALVAEASQEPGSPVRLACMLAAVAVAQAQPAMAEAALELTPAVAEAFLEWQQEQ